jgi:L,D-peptidoglycan transpeptidase YkuD (ErfK/YbiS/YcfS/YnhG family)
LREIEHSGQKEQAELILNTKCGANKMHATDQNAQWMAPMVRIRARPGRRTQGVLTLGHWTIPVVLGRSGIRVNKREGDGATPAGRFRPLRLWWRFDRGPRPRTMLPVHRIEPDLAWCEEPADRRYNRPFRRSANEPGDRLWRADSLYDLIVEIDHNTRPRVAGRGSAVFLHLARPNRGPTAGCVAMGAGELRRLVRRLSPKTRIDIQL